MVGDSKQFIECYVGISSCDNSLIRFMWKLRNVEHDESLCIIYDRPKVESKWSFMKLGRK